MISLEKLSQMSLARALEKPEVSVKTLPPFYMMNAALTARVKTWQSVYLVTVVILVSVIAFQQKIISNKMFDATNREIVVVPGSPEFFRVRPGQIPSESVYLFAEYVASNLGNFTYRNVSHHFGKVTEHMTPVTRGQFDSLFEERLKDFRERKVDQTFAYEPVKNFEIVNDSRGPKYSVVVSGVRTQYVEGHVFSETQDVLLLEFRSVGNLTLDRPYIFDLEKIEWLTLSQYEAIKAAMRKQTQEEK